MRVKTLKEFISYEASGGIILFITAIFAVIIDNSPLHHLYQQLFNLPVAFQLGNIRIAKPLLLWINDGFMSLFFMLVGLEIKREMIEGELNSVAKSTLPAIAALGGMVLPALIYIYFNHEDPTALHGWAIPTATDIAFSLGILSLLGTRLAPGLKIFLTALAIFDDIGAIIIIAIFYTKNISVIMLSIGAICILVLTIFNRLRVVHFAPYFLVGGVLWLAVLKSGVHATLAGIMLAMFIPIRDLDNPDYSPLRDLEHKMHPWVAFGILPIFAFANAGVSFAGLTWSSFLHPVPLGIALGLFVGKQLGIWSFTMSAVRLKIAQLPRGANGVGIYGISLIAGVGFTMSLFISGLAFGYGGSDYPLQARFGIIVGSLLSGLCGYLLLRLALAKPAS